MNKNVELDEQRFKEQFVATFLATYVAQNYTDNCMRGNHKASENPPVEDAAYLANKAWEKYLKDCQGR